MANVTPIQQSPIEDLRNLAQIASWWEDVSEYSDRMDAAKAAFQGIARLVRHAIEGLSEPNLAAMQAGEILIREWHGQFEDRRNLRDTIQGILQAQLSGVVPKTWEAP